MGIDRLLPIERQALETISRALELAKFHLREGTTSEEEILVALILVTDTLSAIPFWIANDTGPGFARDIETNLAHIAQAMERLEVDDFPEPPDYIDPDLGPEPPDPTGCEADPDYDQPQ